jgi:hypothetical protein
MLWVLSRGPVSLAEVVWRTRKNLRRQGGCNQLRARGGWCEAPAVSVDGDEARCEVHSEPS